DVRTAARKALFEVARADKFHQPILSEAERHLAGKRWRALEQSAILLAQFDHKQSARRFVELLGFERPEVFVAAAWALRKLAVRETLPDQLRELERRYNRPQKTETLKMKTMIDSEMAQLAQSLGQARYAPASKALAAFVPKQLKVGPEPRVAAIWALGLI